MSKVIQKVIYPFKFMFFLYADGMSSMSRMSKILWIVALFKLFIMFGILKVFFFQKHLDQFETEEEKIEHISKRLTNQN